MTTSDLDFRTDTLLTIALFIDALTVVAYSALIVSDGLKWRGLFTDEAENEAVDRTAAYFKTKRVVVQASARSLFRNQPCGLADLAAECHRLASPEIIDLARTWLAHRGKPNLLVRPYVH